MEGWATRPQFQKQGQTQESINFNVNCRSGIIARDDASNITSRKGKVDAARKGAPPASFGRSIKDRDVCQPAQLQVLVVMPMNRALTPSLRTWKCVEAAAAVVGVGLALSSAELWMHYAYTRPTMLGAGSGRVYSLNTHGSIVYLNAGERSLLNTLMIIGGVLFVGAVLIDIVKKPFRKE